jgi:hypothetical protein
MAFHAICTKPKNPLNRNLLFYNDKINIQILAQSLH